MMPRRDPETRPAVLAVQLMRRHGTDQYGTERSGRYGSGQGKKHYRPVQTRNGIPVKHYTNWQTPRPSMTEAEAAAHLNVAPGFPPLSARPGATLPKGSPP